MEESKESYISPVIADVAAGTAAAITHKKPTTATPKDARSVDLLGLGGGDFDGQPAVSAFPRPLPTVAPTKEEPKATVEAVPEKPAGNGTAKTDTGNTTELYDLLFENGNTKTEQAQNGGAGTAPVTAASKKGNLIDLD